MAKKTKRNSPKVLLIDIETAPILGYVWRLWSNDVSLNMVHSDWFILSWAAKWLGDKEVMYRDQRGAKNIEDDKKILAEMWKLLNEADIVVTQNGKAFDTKRLNARFILHGFPPPSTYKHIDTKIIAKKHFGFTSNKLEYMADKLCTNKKLKHKKFDGFELWRQCLAGNREAWEEMARYNKQDVLILEELYKKLVPWDDAVNFSLYHDDAVHVCRCGSEEFEKRGFHYTQTGKYQRYRCRECGAWTRDRVNLFSKEKKASLHISTPRG